MHYVCVSTLVSRLRTVIASGRVKSARAWSVDAGLAPAAVQKLLDRPGSGVGKVEIRTLDLLADQAGVARVWLTYGVGMPEGLPSETPDMPAGSFLLKLQDQPALRQEIFNNTERWSVSTIVRALGLELEHDAGGRPVGGWPKILDDIEAGRYERTGPGGSAVVLRATTNQVGKRPKIPKAKT